MADTPNTRDLRYLHISSADARYISRPAVESSPPPAPTVKRPRTESPPRASADADDVSSSDDDIGPSLPPQQAVKKRKTLPYEKLYLGALPAAQRYVKSLMHRDNLAFVTMTPITDFLVTTSTDGMVKFWKKAAEGVEFVKGFRAHQGEIVDVSVSADGRSYATAGADKKIVIWDVITFGRYCGRMLAGWDIK